MVPIWVEIEGNPYGGRLTEPMINNEGMFLLAINIAGQHQAMIAPALSIHEPLTIDLARELGLCPACCGFGTLEEIPPSATYAADEVPGRCAPCGGSGRPALIAYRTRKGIIPHLPITSMSGICLACLEPEDSPQHRLTIVMVPVDEQDA